MLAVSVCEIGIEGVCAVSNNLSSLRSLGLAGNCVGSHCNRLGVLVDLSNLNVGKPLVMQQELT